MTNQIGNYSLYIALFSSIFLIFYSSRLIRNSSIKLDNKIFSILSVQSLMILISFFNLIYAFIKTANYYMGTKCVSGYIELINKTTLSDHYLDSDTE